jgi:endonuclease/exonuclease/phosphatase (EEP) superfamily protein YafD
MDDTGFEESVGDKREAGGLIRRIVLAMRVLLAVTVLALMAVTLAGDRFVLTEWLGHVHPLFWLPALLLVPLSWMRWLVSLLTGLFLLMLISVNLYHEQPNLFRISTAKPTVPASDTVRMSFWNVMSFNRGEELVHDGFLSDDPDIVCLVEGTYQGAVHDSLSRAMGRDYKWVSIRQMAVGSRLPILRSREIPTRTRLRMFEVRIVTADGPVGIVLADLPSPPRIDSRPIMQELGAILSTVEPPFILVGDLNTSRGSWRLQRATRGLRDFYTEVGSARWLATFPDHVPLWQIDHAFAGPGVEPRFARFGEGGSSNHLRITVGFTVKDFTAADDDQAFAPATQ